MKSISEVWKDGILISTTEKDDASPEELALREAYKQAIIDLTKIVDYVNPNTNQIIWAIKRLAEIERAELRYHARGFYGVE